MKKIAVFTLQGLVNYGNRLQNFAVEYILKEKGIYPHSIIVTKYPTLKPVIMFVKMRCLSLFAHKAKRIEARRQILFSKFNRLLNIKYYDINKLSNLNDEYDAVLVGSDQVWNPRFDNNHIFLLPFANKRLCISPSFGVDVISDDFYKMYREELKKYDYLSVRENSGKKIIFQLTGIEAEVLIDPTMVIDKTVWERLEKKPFGINNNKYILSYTLGELSNKREKLINRVTEMYPYEHIAIFDNLNDNKYIVGPREFLWLIHHAEIIITDSFHASVFSILYQKPFITINREGEADSMNDRIQTLLGKFNLELCYEEHADLEKIANINYAQCNEQLAIERKKFYDYLKKILLA